MATGLAVVGDLIGSGAAEEQAVIGETPNLAARLQVLAGPDEIVIPENTRRLVGNLFDYESLGEVEVKGLPAASEGVPCSPRERGRQSLRDTEDWRDATHWPQRRTRTPRPPMG